MDLNRSVIPKKNLQRDNWAYNAFKEWQTCRIALPDESYKEAIQREIQLWNDPELNYWIPKFIYEVRKKNGLRYPGKSLVSMVAGLQHKINLLDSKRCVNFFRKECFKDVHEALDANMKISAQNGIGLHTKSAEVVSRDEEDLLWNTSQLGSENPTQLLNTLFFMNGLHFAIRGGEEHRALEIHQFEVMSKPGQLRKIVYKEGTTKTYSGGLSHQIIKPKIKEHHENLQNPERCHVRLFEKYLQMRPVNAVAAFYLKPLNKVSSSGPWYSATTVIGVTKLKSIMKTICTNAGITGRKSNHSLKATCATRLFQEGIDEQVIMEKTGHRSVRGVRAYKRINDAHIYSANVAIDGQSVKKFLTSNDSNMNGMTFNINATNVTIFNGNHQHEQNMNNCI